MDFWIILLVVFVLVDLLIVIYVFYKRKKRDISPLEKKKYREHWNKIKNNADYRHAIMDADKLLDFLLMKKGYQGSLGEKLKESKALFRDLDGVWSAHKLRNRIAHEIGIIVSAKEAKMALKQFEKAYKDLGLL